MSCSSSQISNFTRLVPFNLQFNYFIAVLFGYDERYTAYRIFRRFVISRNVLILRD